MRRATVRELATRIAAILARPDREHFGDLPIPCTCARCRALRRPRTCETCGYLGPFIVDPCECASIKADNIEHATAAIEAGRQVEYNQRLLAESLAKPDAPCKAHWNIRAGTCGHGWMVCPCCSSARFSDDPGAEVLARKVKAVHALLTEIHD